MIGGIPLRPFGVFRRAFPFKNYFNNLKLNLRYRSHTNNRKFFKYNKIFILSVEKKFCDRKFISMIRIITDNSYNKLDSGKLGIHAGIARIARKSQQYITISLNNRVCQLRLWQKKQLSLIISKW